MGDLRRQAARQVPEEVREHRLRRLRRDGKILLHRLLHLHRAFLLKRLLLPLVPCPLLVEEGLEPLDRIVRPRPAQLIRRAVARRIIGGGVVAETVGEGFDQRRLLVRKRARVSACCIAS